MVEVHLRRLRRADTSELAKLANNRNVWDNVRDYFPHPYSEKDAEFFISSKVSEDPQITFAIEFEGRFAGIVGLEPQQDVYAHTCEIGYWIGEAYWGKGIATQAVNLATTYAFETLGLLKVYAGVFEFNKGSMRVLEKAGYLQEAILKSSVQKNNMIVDEVRYCIFRK
ncbi:MAG: GNAT family protein [Cytophagales bacterium]|nr:GNAT family protein [Cytophagales bacterium]